MALAEKVLEIDVCPWIINENQQMHTLKMTWKYECKDFLQYCIISYYLLQTLQPSSFVSFRIFNMRSSFIIFYKHSKQVHTNDFYDIVASIFQRRKLKMCLKLTSSSKHGVSLCITAGDELSATQRTFKCTNQASRCWKNVAKGETGQTESN